MAQTRKINITSERISAAAQMFHAASVEILTSAAPVFGMVPSAILTAIHLHEIMGLWAIPATFGIDAIGISLATIRASLPRMEMTQHDKSVRDDFRYYLIVTVGVNVSLSVYVNFFKSGDPINSIGPFIAETFLSFLPYFVAKIIALNAEQAAKVAALDDAKVTEALNAAQVFEESERAKDSEHKRLLELKAAEAAAEMERKQFEAAEAEKLRAAIAKERAERLAMKSASVATAPANSATAKTAPATAAKQPCKFGCGKLVTGTAGQNAHSDKCPNNPANK